MIVNLFPQLLSYSELGIFMLRVALALIFLEFGYTKFTTQKKLKVDFFETIGLKPGERYVKIFAGLEIAIGLGLLVGIYTQAMALLAALILLGTTIIKKRKPALLPSELRYYIIIFLISFTILLTGAGSYSIDLPL